MKKKNKIDKKIPKKKQRKLLTIIPICIILLVMLVFLIGYIIGVTTNKQPNLEKIPTTPNKDITNNEVDNGETINRFKQEVFSEEEKQVDMSKILKELQTGTRKISTKTNEYTFDEYLKLNNYNEDYKKYYYSMIDLDDDGILEIVIFVDGYNEIILNYNNNIVYGYNDISLHNLKVDGTFEGRTDKGYDAIVKLNTYKGEYQKDIKAYMYYQNYFIDDESVTEDEYDNFISDWEKKDDIKYVYVYNNKEYQPTDFEIKNSLAHKDKNRIEKLAYTVLDIINGPSYGTGSSYCGEMNHEDNFTIESEDSFSIYSRSKTYKSIQDLNNYWKNYFSSNYLKGIETEFIEKDNKLYCNTPAKDGGDIYDKDKTKFKVLSENNKEMIVIGRVWTKESPDNAYSSTGYFHIYLKLI